MYMHMHTEICTEQAYGRMNASKHGKARSIATLSAKRTAGTTSAGGARTEAISSGATGVRWPHRREVPACVACGIC